MRQDKSYNEHTAGVFQVAVDALTRYLCFIVLTYVNKKKLPYAVLPLAGDLPTGRQARRRRSRVVAAGLQRLGGTPAAAENQ